VPIEGMTDCIAVLPAAVTSITANSSATRAAGKLVVAPGAAAGCSERAEDIGSSLAASLLPCNGGTNL
jgi:hypothetical protein